MKNFCQSKICKTGVWTGKIAITVLLVFITYEMYAIKMEKTSDVLVNTVRNIIPTFIVIVVFLPTIFVFFFKKRFVARYPKFAEFWKFGRVFYGIIVALFLAYAVWSAWISFDKDRTEKAVFRINSVRITIADVMGENPPPKPDQTLNDSTIEGIDANDNFIRDDVELAIFEKYPDSAKIRAAMLQYAQALQMELTMVFNSETLVAAMRKETSGAICIGETAPQISLERNTPEEIKSFLAIGDKRQEKVESLIFNIPFRKQKVQDLLEKFMTSYSSSNKVCDVDLKLLPN